MFAFLGRTEEALHRFCQENLSAYVDGRLSAGDRDRVLQHIQHCQTCRGDLKSLQRTVDLLRDLPRVEAPRSFELPRSVPAPVVPLWTRNWVYGATRAATVAAAVLFVLTLSGTAWSTRTAGHELLLSEAPAAAVTQRQEAPAVAQPVPMATAAAPAEAKALAAPTQGVGAAREAGAAAATAAPQPTFESPEAATRAALAPPGLGAGPDPRKSATGPGARGDATPMAPAPSASGMGGGSEQPVPTGQDQESLTAQVEPSPLPEVAANRADGMADKNLAGPDDTSLDQAQYGQPRLDLWARQTLAQAVHYPWAWWAAVAGSLFAVLALGTLWLGAARSRWP